MRLDRRFRCGRGERRWGRVHVEVSQHTGARPGVVERQRSRGLSRRRRRDRVPREPVQRRAGPRTLSRRLPVGILGVRVNVGCVLAQQLAHAVKSCFDRGSGPGATATGSALESKDPCDVTHSNRGRGANWHILPWRVQMLQGSRRSHCRYDQIGRASCRERVS